MTKPIELNKVQDVQRICRMAQKFNCEIWVHSDTKMMDAKSPLGLSSMIGEENLFLVFPDDIDIKIIEKELKK